MANTDTIKLLKECDSGTKMAVSSIDEILEDVTNPDLRALLTTSKEQHTTLGNELHSLLLNYASEEKDPAPIAKGMSWIKTNMKMTMDKSDATVADLITDGCNMGIKSLHRYLNEYSAADKQSQDICNQIITIEETLARELRCYL